MAKSKPEATLADYEKALANACRDLPLLLVVQGQEDCLRRQAVEAFSAALRRKHPQVEVLTLYGPAASKEERLPLTAVMGELEANSLFAAERAVVLRRAEHLLFGGKGESGEGRAGEKEDNKALSAAEAKLAAYFAKPLPGMWLIIETRALDRHSRLGKVLAAKASIIPCPEVKQQAEILRWLRQRARHWHKEIEPRAAEMLIASHGSRLGALDAEIEKLALYVGERPTIAVDDVSQFLSGSLEFEIFGLTQAVEERDLRQALLYAQRIVEHGVRDQAGRKADGESSGQMALALLSRTLQGLISARLAVSAGESSQSLASRLGIHPYRAQRLYEAAKRFTLRELRYAISAIAEEFRASHDTGGDIKVALLRSVVACCGRPRAGHK
ncbi:MAG: DNA polymerase III subunit delta [Planctomycetota bacterium]|nr:DNA polymerase III subunit delta [Planctomycetota bacterium]